MLGGNNNSENQGLRDRIKELEQRIDDLEHQDTPDHRNQQATDADVDRRTFLKTAGAVGLGTTLFGKNASAYQIRSNYPSTVANQNGDTHFQVRTDGTLDLQGNDITSVNTLQVDRVRLRDNTGHVFASQFDGDDLTGKIQNALDYIDDVYGRTPPRIYVTPRDDGESWVWDDELVVDASDPDRDGHDGHNGFELIISENAVIEYPRDGVALTVNVGHAPGKPSHGTETGPRVNITGGQWYATGNPDGWLRLEDVVGATVRNCWVEFGEKGGDDDAFGISLENYDNWTELTVIENCRILAARCINSLTADETGGPGGRTSFQGTTITDVFLQASEFGIRFSGNWRYTQVRRPNIFPRDDNAAGLVLDAHRMSGCVLSSLQVEAGSDNNANIIEVGDGFDYWWGPLFLNPDSDLSASDSIHNPDNERLAVLDVARGRIRMGQYGGDDEIEFDPNGGNISATGAITAETAETEIGFRNLDLEGYSHNINFTDNSTHQLTSGDETMIELEGEDGITFEFNNPVDVIGTIDGPSKGYTAYHDGSGDNTEGPAFYDGSDWISLVDNSTID